MPTEVGSRGVDRWYQEMQREISVEDIYTPWPHQIRFHESPKPYRFLGGAAGPGKSLAGIMEHVMSCYEHNPDEGKEVHTLMLRRTYPRLMDGIVTRFKEKVPKEFYRSFVETSGRPTVTWHNNASSVFGAMQHESDAFNFQAQWKNIFFDELCEFTFKQFSAISAWNRCPVSEYCTKDGAGNPIGIGAQFVESLFVRHEPCDEMDEDQRRAYNPNDYEFIPCTYKDNPIYANDARYIAQFGQYRKAVADALMLGIWGAAGGYFQRVWDEAENVYDESTFKVQPWYPKWLGGDAGYEHMAAIYWMCMDEFGFIRVYREHCIKHCDPETLAQHIVELSKDDGGRFEGFYFSHDAFSSMETRTYGQNPNSIATRMAPILIKGGLPGASPSTRDKWGRERLLHDMLGQRIQVDGKDRARLQIAKSCEKLIRTIPRCKAKDDDPEVIEEFLGDDPIQGVSYGLFGRFGYRARKPYDVQLRENIIKSIGDPENPNYNAAFMTHARMEDQRIKQQQNFGSRSQTMQRRQRRYL